MIRSLNQTTDAAAVQGARTWRYEAAPLDGDPVRVYGIVAVRFEFGR